MFHPNTKPTPEVNLIVRQWLASFDEIPVSDSLIREFVDYLREEEPGVLDQPMMMLVRSLCAEVTLYEMRKRVSAEAKSPAKEIVQRKPQLKVV